MAGGVPISGDPGLAPLHLFTDAACQRHGKLQVSAWAALLVLGDNSNLQAGLLQRGVTESLDAELLAVAYSLEFFIKAGMVPPGSRLIVHTDNQAGVQYLNGKARPRLNAPRNRATVEHIDYLVAQERLTLSATWVKAHQGFDATCWRGLLNARVDREARRIARAHRATLQKADAA